MDYEEERENIAFDQGYAFSLACRDPKPSKIDYFVFLKRLILDKLRHQFVSKIINNK